MPLSLSKHIIAPTIFVFVVIFMLTIATICLINAIEWINKPFAGILFYEYPVIGSFGDYKWSGIQAGARYGDVVVEVNGQKISSGREIEKIANQTVLGENIHYILDRRGEKIRLSAPVILFTFTDFLKIFGIPFLVGIIVWMIGVIVYILKRDTTATWTFLLLCLSLGTYMVTGFEVQSTYLRLIYLNLIGNVFFAAGFIHLGLVFPERIKLLQERPWLQVLPYLIPLVLIIYGAVHFLVLISGTLDDKEIIFRSSQMVRTFQFTRLYVLVGTLTFVASIFYTYWRSTSVIAKQRSRVVLLGFWVAFVPAAVGMALVGMNKLVIPFNFFALLVAAFPAAIGYAIAKHNLFDVDVYIKRTVGYVIMTVVVGMAYFSIQSLLSTFILKPLLGENAEKAYPIIFALLVVFLFNPINRKVQEGVDRLFYRKRYDYKATIASVTNALTSLLDFDEIIKKVIGTVRNEMFIDTAGVIVLDPKKQACQTFFIGDGPNNTKDQTRDIPASYDDPLLALLSKEKKLITRYDIAEDPKYKDMQGACGKRFQEIEATIAIPLIYQDKLTGLLALGNKKSGHFYTREDIDLLTTLASQGTIAIENAKLFKEHLEKGRMEEELKIAHDIQLSMLPDKVPEIEGFKIAARSIPAREVGGDFYDFIEIRSEGKGGRLGIIIGDVSGKGVSAALMMAASRSIYRVLADAHPSVEDLMSMGNKLLNRDIKKGMFVSLLYAELNPEGKILTLSNAGQTKPVICPGDRSRPSFIDTDGDKFPLGIIGDCKYQEKQVPLKEGDTIAFYTDGIVEAMNGKEEMYGFDRLLTSIEEGRGLDAEAMLEKLMNDISNFVRGVEQHDDLTLVVVKVG